MAESKSQTTAEIRQKNLEFACDNIMSRGELAAVYDCSPSYITNMINGAKGIGEKTARKLEIYLNKPPNWMDTPQWDLTAPTDVVEALDKSAVTEKSDSCKHYPRVVGTARCGDHGYYMDLEGGDGYIEFDAGPGAIAIRIKGHSMHPAIREGWYVIIEPNKPPDLGEYVLVKFKDDRKMVKELLQIKSDSYLLLSINGNERLTADFADLEGIQAITAIVPPSKHKEW